MAQEAGRGDTEGEENGPFVRKRDKVKFLMSEKHMRKRG